MSKHLIIGGSGQVGQHLAQTLEAAGTEVSATYWSCPVPGMHLLDIRDPAATVSLVEALRPTVIYLPASLTNVDYCELHPAEGYVSNVLGVQHVVQLANHVKAKVVYFSSDYIFDGEAGPYREADPANPPCEYGRQKGVGIRVWVHWAALYPKLDSAFAQYEKWGLSGMMVDFMDRDDQEMVNIQEEILRKAAAHHLHIQFHGAYKPTGRQRSYPNEFTREGTLNFENAKWNNRVTPDHDLNIVFTRGLAGSTDYHLGGFRAVRTGQFRVQNTRPLMLGTRAHQLAMYLSLIHI